MRMTLGRNFGLMGGAVLAAGIAGSAHATIATGIDLVTDGSFENVAGPFGGGNANRLRVTSWFEINDDGSSNTEGFSEAAQGGGVNSTPTAPQGTYWLNLAPRNSTNPSGVYQQLGVWNTGDATEYNLTATLGERSNTPDFSDMRFDLYATDATFNGANGTDVLDTGTLVGTFGNFTQANLGAITPSATISGISDGQELWLRISSNIADNDGANQSLVDIVTVTAVDPIPEPASLALMGLGGLLMLGRSRHSA